jgi:hypothetical protein
MSALTYAWNRHRAGTYPNIKYEWPRVFAFAAGSAVLAAASLGTVREGWSGELTQSAVLWALALLLVYFCLHATERRQLMAKFKVILHGTDKRML